MAFVNHADYLEESRSADEMRIKETAPLFSRPTSPEKKLTIRLEGIPEATPGPNAFAQEAARLERHRLDSNAFYQQEVHKRKVTPLTGVHPALRPRSNSDPPTPPRLSCCTTMSPFVNAGKDKENSPPLKLVPDSCYAAEPTQRGYIEEQREQLMHERSKSKEERIPVFVPTPKMTSNAFEKSRGPAGVRGEKHKEGTAPEAAIKTPKRSLLEKLRLTTNLLGISSPAAAAHDTIPEAEAEFEEKMPVKAKAVFGTSPSKGKTRTSLGSSPSKVNLPRSPSKRKGFFSRKNTDIPSIHASQNTVTRQSASSDQPPPTASSITKTPPTALSDPTHWSYQGKRLDSQTYSDQGTDKGREAHNCVIARSQSLKYFDHAIPPTPPAKNTPPEEKAKKEAALKSQSSRMPFHDDQTTPSKSPTGIVSTSDRLSPTKFGGYGHRETATLITRPSVYSLHASVVPNLNEASTFEEMKARIDGLGLEGFSMPQEHMRSPRLAVGYTPSIYSTEFSPRPNSAFAKLSPMTPQGPSHSKDASMHTKSSSSNGEIPVYYPELARDPSVNDMVAGSGSNGFDRSRSKQRAGFLEAQIPWHGYTHSRDHSNSPRHSVSSAIFARHIDDDGLDEKYHDSPTSFSHVSATPSPLHFLPATTYTPPPPRRSSKRAQRTETTNTDAGIDTPAQPRSPGNALFENIPSFRAGAPSPKHSLHDQTNVDPLKSSPPRSPSREKADRTLHRLGAHNSEIKPLRASNARLSATASAVSECASEWIPQGRPDQRVPTSVARDFYRLPDGDGGPAQESEREASATVAKLVETNRRLLEMCGGFAEKIRRLEERIGRGG